MTQLTTALATVQAALYARLSGDSTLSGLITGVFDEVPELQLFPYITIANNLEMVNDTFGRRGRDVTVTLDIWTQPKPTGAQARGFLTALAILAQCVTLLDRIPLVLSSGTMSYLNYTGTPQMLRDPDDQITRHIVARFDGCVEE